jgi:hypothetical protein
VMLYYSTTNLHPSPNMLIKHKLFHATQSRIPPQRRATCTQSKTSKHRRNAKPVQS